jgi:inosine triphosphate pyrophosphatase
MTEDTALVFHAMNRLPGPYIKDFMENIGHAGESSDRNLLRDTL